MAERLTQTVWYDKFGTKVLIESIARTDFALPAYALPCRRLYRHQQFPTFFQPPA